MSGANPVPSQPTPAGDAAQMTKPVGETDRRRWLFLVRVVAVLLLAILGYKVIRVGWYGLSAYNNGMQILALREDGDLDGSDLVSADSALAEAARSVAAMEREMRFMAPALRAAGVVPGVGPTIASVPDILSAGRELAMVASEVLSLIVSTIEEDGDAPILDLGLAVLVENPESVALLAQRAASAQSVLENVEASELVGSLAQPVRQLQSAVSLLVAGLELGPILPAVLGSDEPQTYLMLVQNNHELRATGGFISAIGEVTVSNAQPDKIDLTDSYNVVRHDVNHPRAPGPMKEYMDIALVFVRDANWSPDFPTSAKLIRALYAQDVGRAVDGVITVDVRAVELLVSALGFLEVEGASEPVTGENFTDQIVQFWDQPLATDDTVQSEDVSEWWKQRKDFMPALAEAALTRIERGDFNPLALADALHTALNERAIQVWFVDEAAAERMAFHAWDGSLQPEPGADFLALVDTNTGYNKVDSVLKRSLQYEVTWPGGPEQPALARVTVTYAHPLEVPNHECDPAPHYGENYDAMTRRCYFDYVRLYAPGGSDLVDVEGVDRESIASQIGEHNTQVFSAYFVLAPGDEQIVTFTYRLPAWVTPDSYRLIVQRQAGASAYPFSATVGDQRYEKMLTEGLTYFPD